MPDTEFLEKYPLYRKFYFDIPYKLDDIEEVNINMYCEICESNQTFNMEIDYSKITAFLNNDSIGQVVLIRYLCAHCNRHRRFFIIRIDKSRKYIEKVGQYPPWDISVEPNIQKVLGEYLKFFKNGLICESQGYGITTYFRGGVYFCHKLSTKSKKSRLLDVKVDKITRKSTKVDKFIQLYASQLVLKKCKENGL